MSEELDFDDFADLLDATDEQGNTTSANAFDPNAHKEERKALKRQRIQVDKAIARIKKAIIRLRRFEDEGITDSSLAKINAAYTALGIKAKYQTTDIKARYERVVSALREDVHGAALNTAQMCKHMGFSNRIRDILRVSRMPRKTRIALETMAPPQTDAYRDFVKAAGVSKATIAHKIGRC